MNFIKRANKVALAVGIVAVAVILAWLVISNHAPERELAQTELIFDQGVGAEIESTVEAQLLSSEASEAQQDAEDTYKAAPSLSLDAINSRFADAVIAYHNGEPEAARTLYLELIASNPELLEAHYNLAVLQLEEADIEAARTTLESALMANTPIDLVSEALGAIYRSQAAHAYAKALGNDKAKLQAPILEPLETLSQASLTAAKLVQLQQAHELELAGLKERLANVLAQLEAKQAELDRALKRR